MNGYVFLVLGVRCGLEHPVRCFAYEQDAQDYIAQCNIEESRYSRLTYIKIAID